MILFESGEMTNSVWGSVGIRGRISELKPGSVVGGGIGEGGVGVVAGTGVVVGTGPGRRLNPTRRADSTKFLIKHSNCLQIHNYINCFLFIVNELA